MEDAKNTDPRTIFIRGISFSVDDAQLTEHFSAIGPVRHAFLIKSKDAQKHKGYGFVHYALEEDAERAIDELHGTELGGRKMHIESAVKRAPFEDRKQPIKKSTKDNDHQHGKKIDTTDDDAKDSSSDEEAKKEEHDEEEPINDKRRAVQKTAAPPQLPNQPKKGSEKHVLLRTVALGGLSSSDIDAAVTYAKSVSKVESVDIPAPPTIIRQYKFIQDGCTGDIILLTYASIKDALAAVAALHGKDLPKDLQGLKKRGKKHKLSGQHVSKLWARQVSGEGLHLKRWRVIVRNLPFNATEKDIRAAFGPAGPIWEISMPLMPDGRPRGFAFVGFVCRTHAEKSIQLVNATKIAGRKVAVDWAVSKIDYENTNDGNVEEKAKKKKDIDIEQQHARDDDDDDKSAGKRIRKTVLGQDDDVDMMDIQPEQERGMLHTIIDDILGKDEEEEEEKEEEENDEEENDEEENDEEENDEEENDEEENDEEEKGHKIKRENAVDRLERRTSQIAERLEKSKQQQEQGPTDATVFVRGLPLDITKDDVFHAMRPFGQVRSCRIVMHKKTGKSKGTAFVDFRFADAARAAVEASAKAAKKEGPGIVVGGRKVEVDPALDSNAARQLATEKSIGIDGRDRRNLYLAKEGVIMEGTAAWEDLSTSDKSKRKRAAEDARLKLRSPNFCVSMTRLNVRNVPRAWDEKKIKAEFIAAVKQRASKANPKVVQVKILREDESRGVSVAGRSKGIAFVEFSDHEHALCALRQLNNNPTTWGKEQRPIIEFAIDNVKALKLRESKLAKAKAKADGNGDEEEAAAAAAAEKKRKKKGKSNKENQDGGDQDGEPKSKRKLRQERRMMLKKLQRQQQGKQDDDTETSSKSKRRREQRKKKKDSAGENDGGDGNDGNGIVAARASAPPVLQQQGGAVRKRKQPAETLLDVIARESVEEGRVVKRRAKKSNKIEELEMSYRDTFLKEERRSAANKGGEKSEKRWFH